MLTFLPIAPTLLVLIVAASCKPQPHRSRRRRADILDVRPYRKD